MKMIFAAILVIASTSLAFAGAEDKKVWGGGDPKSSAYSGVYVPHVIEVLEENRLAGYQWAGKSEGTVQNAQEVSENPTHLAVGQYDILKTLQGTSYPGGTYAFTFLFKDIGPECLYAVTAQKGYSSWGHILGNAWDLTIFTGGEKSGSYGTLKHLMSIYPDLADIEVVHAGSMDNILDAVAQTPSSFGFFVMRPDPSSAIFKKIDQLDLTLVPVVDFDLEGEYEFKELKVAYGGLLSDAKYHTTACTSVSLITGDPAAVDQSDTRTLRRLKATIERVGSLSEDELKPNTSTWRDMFDSMKAAASEKTKALMEQSKQAFDEAVKQVQ